MIPSTVTVIEDYAFYYCKNLTKIKLPDNLVAIRVAAFTYCTSLKSIIIPQKVATIGGSAFISCSNLKEVVCRGKIPPAMVTDGFSSSIYGNATLYAPASSKELYTTTDYWKKFSAFRGIGDVNQDGRVNVADVMALVNYVLGHSVIDFEQRIGDVNFDDNINVTDIMGVVGICLGNN